MPVDTAAALMVSIPPSVSLICMRVGVAGGNRLALPYSSVKRIRL